MSGLCLGTRAFNVICPKHEASPGEPCTAHIKSCQARIDRATELTREANRAARFGIYKPKGMK